MHLRLPAPAKINLHLHVTALQKNGMHALHTSFAYTEACDLLTFTHSYGIEVSCSQAHLSGEENLVYKVLHAFRQQHHISQGLAVHIDKYIPQQAGLGGGSSDAATAIIAANELWSVHASIDELIAFATPFGADIPCFLYGRASLACGIGATLTDYPYALPAQTLVLAWPGSGLSTADVFDHFDSTLTTPETLDTIRRNAPLIGQNDLEFSACTLNPNVSQLLEYMRENSDKAWVSGSGSACVALFECASQAADMVEQLQQQQLASWTHIGKLSGRHPLEGINWDVAKR